MQNFSFHVCTHIKSRHGNPMQHVLDSPTFSYSPKISTSKNESVSRIPFGAFTIARMCLSLSWTNYTLGTL